MTGEKVTNEYDVNNQLTKSVKTKSGETLYTQVNTYNDLGQRISKTDNGVTTYYYYQGDILLYTTDAAGNKTSQNIVGPQDNIIATIRYNNGQHAYFYNKDIRTSVINVVDESGKGVVSYKYDDYGTTTKYGDEDFYNEICYTSGVYDDLTSRYYLNARYYNPSTATFITQDSYRGEKDDYSTWNLYAYCGGNSIVCTDPSGHRKEKVYGVKLEVKRKKTNQELTDYAKALYKISDKKKFKNKYPLFKIKVARKVLVAQSAWECGYGTSPRAKRDKNLFGIRGGKYKSYKESIEAYAWQLNNGTQKGYKSARKYLKEHKKDAKGYLLKFAGTYCTSSAKEEYTQTIIDMMGYIKNRGVWK